MRFDQGRNSLRTFNLLLLLIKITPKLLMKILQLEIIVIEKNHIKENTYYYEKNGIFSLFFVHIFVRIEKKD